MEGKPKTIRGVIDLDLRDIEVNGESWKNIGRMTWEDENDPNIMYQVAICTQEKDVQQVSLNPRRSTVHIQVRYRQYQEDINHIDTKVFDTTPETLYKVSYKDPNAESAAVAMGILNYRRQQMRNLH